MNSRETEVLCLTLGWAWSEACVQLDKGEDPRKYDMAELLHRAQEEIRDPE